MNILIKTVIVLLALLASGCVVSPRTLPYGGHVRGNAYNNYHGNRNYDNRSHDHDNHDNYHSEHHGHHH